MNATWLQASQDQHPNWKQNCGSDFHRIFLLSSWADSLERRIDHVPGTGLGKIVSHSKPLQFVGTWVGVIRIHSPDHNIPTVLLDLQWNQRYALVVDRLGILGKIP